MKQNISSNSLASTKKEKVFYSIGDVGVNLLWILPTSFLTLYYTDSVGMNAAYIGTMMLICRLFDGVSDILMGTIIDKTRTRWGKARPWLLFMILPLVLSVLFVFSVPQELTETGQKIYSFITYFIMSVVCYTALNLSYHVLLPRFSLTSQDRSIVSVIRTIFAMIATIVVMSFTPKLIEGLGGEHNPDTWRIIVILYGAVALVAIITTFLGVKERLPLDTINSESKEGNHSIIKGIRILLSSRYFYISVFLFLSFYVANGISGINVYYARDVLGDVNLLGLISMVSLAPMLVAMPFVPALFKRIGKRKAMMAGLLVSTVAIIVILIDPRNKILFLTMSFIRSIGAVPLAAALYTLAGDIVDYNQWKTGIRLEGITTSINSFGMKLGTGLGSAVLGWLLAWGKYNGSAITQSDSAITAMIIIAVIVPIVINIIAFILLSLWDIEKYQPEIIDFLQGRKSTQES